MSAPLSVRGLRDPSPRPTEDTVDVARLLAVVGQRWKTVVAITLLTFALVMGVTLRSHMTFSSSGRLYLGELSSAPPPAGEEVDISAGPQGDVSSEVEILTSRSLIAKAVLESGLNARLMRAGEEQPRYWKWIVSDRDPGLFDVAYRTLRVNHAAFEERRRDRAAYRLAFRDSSNFDVVDLNVPHPQTVAAGSLGMPVQFQGVEFTATKVPGAEVNTGDGFTLTIEPVSATVGRVLETLSVVTPKSTGSQQPNVVSLWFSDVSPFLCAEFLNALMRAYLHERQEWKTENASAAEAFVSQQLKSMRASLDKAQRDLAEFRANNRVVVLDSEAEVMIGQIGRYEEQRVAARLEIESLADVDRELSRSNPTPEAFMLGEARDSVLGGMAGSLADSRRKLAELETRFSAEAPDVINMRAQVAAQLEAIRRYVTGRLSRARENIGTLGGIIGKYEEKLRTVPSAELGLAQLTREAEVYDALYTFLLKRQQQAAVTKASTVSKNRVLDQPEIPFWEDSPKATLRLASAPLGILLGIAVVLVASMFSRHFQSSADVASLAGRIPISATLPMAVSGNRLGSGSTDGMLTGRVSASFLEAFRTLRTNLYLAAPAVPNEGKVILITSPAPGDGKTTCALSLAWVLAADGQKVLIVDTDVRNPLHALAAEPPHENKDLGAVLNGECAWQAAALPVRGAPQSIMVLGARTPGPAELLSGANLRRFLNQARKDCDYIILDSPSFPLVSDALVMAQASDLTLSVVRLNHTPRKLAVEHISRISGSSNSYSLVVNDAESSSAYGELSQLAVAT